MQSEAKIKNSVEEWLYPQSMLWVALFLLLPVVAVGLFWMCRSHEPTIVRAIHDLAPYTIVRPEDLEEVAGLTHVSRAVKTKTAAINQITVTPIPRNKILTDAMLYNPGGGTQLTGWLVSVSLGAMPSPAIGEVVKVVTLEQEDRELTTVCDQAIALGVNGDQVILAIPKESVKATAFTLLSKKQILILRNSNR